MSGDEFRPIGAQTPTPAPSPEWGLHLLDASLSLGNLLSIVQSEEASYTARREAVVAAAAD